MSQALLLKQPLQNILTAKTTHKVGRYAMLYVIGLVLLIASSKLFIPLQPIPVTLQTFAVLLIGMVYGARLGTFTVLSFIALGLCGLPLLAGAVTGATMGYLVGFVPAAFVAGTLVERGWGASILTTVLAAFLGECIIFISGVAWFSTLVGFSTALNTGLMPFIPVEVVKIVALALIAPWFWKHR